MHTFACLHTYISACIQHIFMCGFIDSHMHTCTCVYAICIYKHRNKNIGMDLCLPGYIHTYIYTYIHTYKHTCACLHICIQTHRNTLMQVWPHTCIVVHVCTYMHTYINANTHAYICVHIWYICHTGVCSRTIKSLFHALGTNSSVTEPTINSTLYTFFEQVNFYDLQKMVLLFAICFVPALGYTYMVYTLHN